jgi:hypothetical protein
MSEFRSSNTDSYNDANAYHDFMNNTPARTSNTPNNPNNDITISDNNYQQFISSDASISQSYPQYIGQNPTSQSYPPYIGQNSTSQSYPQYIEQNQPQQSPHSTLPPINSLNITINSQIDIRSGFKIIIMPITNSDIQSQPQQGQSYSSSNSSQTQFQQ